MVMKKITFLAIGDITNDAFIELIDAEAHCNIDNENCTICMPFGAKIPYKDVVEIKAVGNASNAAVCASRLGLASALRAYIGDDQNGRDCIGILANEKVSTEYIVTENGKKTNYHYVLQYGAERTILIKHVQFNYSWPKDIVAPDWIYFSSIAENSLPYHKEIIEYLKSNPNSKLAFQPGTFQIKLGKDSLSELYKQREIFFSNNEEAEEILGLPSGTEIKTLLAGIHSLGSKTTVISDGPRGAYAFDGVRAYFVPMYPDPKPPISRTGAGDAFSSTMTCLIAQGMNISDALLRAPINSMNVVQYIGAQKGLLTQNEIEELLAQAPEDYKVSEI